MTNRFMVGIDGGVYAVNPAHEFMGFKSPKPRRIGDDCVIEIVKGHHYSERHVRFLVSEGQVENVTYMVDLSKNECWMYILEGFDMTDQEKLSKQCVLMQEDGSYLVLRDDRAGEKKRVDRTSLINNATVFYAHEIDRKLKDLNVRGMIIEVEEVRLVTIRTGGASRWI